MVDRLVQDEQIRAARDQHRQHQPHPLAKTQLARQAEHIIAREQEKVQKRARFGVAALRPGSRRARCCAVEDLLFLGQIADLDAGPDAHPPGQRRHFADDRLQQRTFAVPFGPRTATRSPARSARFRSGSSGLSGRSQSSGFPGR